jgi:4-hydroxythreonine-4-phosphate dehydrogenase
MPITEIAQARHLPPGQIPVLQVTPDAPLTVGQISANAGRMAAEAVIWAAKAALRREVAAVVTAPLHKKALSLAGFDYPGHTEMLQALAAQHQGVSVSELPVRMMLSCPGLRTVLVSIHVSLREAVDAVKTANVWQTIQVVERSWQSIYGRHANMWVAGLNPHAGEEGLFGSEEAEQIAPAVAQATAAGLLVSGPFAPDTVFMRALKASGKEKPDVVIAMYHDQGLIPVKLNGVEHGVNHTLGLPFVRTSPDHGTAFDIAGRGQADHHSLLAAVAAAKNQL